MNANPASAPHDISANQRLQDELAFVRQNAGVDQRMQAMLMDAARAFGEGNYTRGAELALQALDINDLVAVGWNILALCLECMGENARAISCFERVLQLDPKNTDVLLNLGLLASRLDMQDAAEQFMRMYCAAVPQSSDGANNLATILRDKGQYVEAIDILKAAIILDMENTTLWNSMGTVMNDMQDVDNALTFFGEAIRLDPRNARAHYNRGNILALTGPVDQAIADFDAAQNATTSDEDRAHVRYAHAQALLASGQLATAWQAYEARFDPHYPGTTRFTLPKPRWQCTDGLSGKRLLLVGEQGLGDEILFMNAAASLMEAIGPDGKLFIACEKRLMPLFARSFPDAVVGPHLTISDNGRPVRLVPFMATKISEYDCWAPMASVLAVLRDDLSRFPQTDAFLTPDPVRVAHWREQLAAMGPGPKIGVTWKSLKDDARRQQYYMPLAHWGPMLSAPVTYISLQNGDAAADLALIKQHYGTDVHVLDGIDLRNDLDELAALTAALDGVVGPLCATTNIAMACGCPALILSSSRFAWPLLGTQDRLPWYPTARVFGPEQLGDWNGVATAIGAAITDLCTATTGRKKRA